MRTINTISIIICIVILLIVSLSFIIDYSWESSQIILLCIFIVFLFSSLLFVLTREKKKNKIDTKCMNVDKVLDQFMEIRKAIDLAKNTDDLNGVLKLILDFSNKYKEPTITIKLELLSEIKRSEIKLLNKIEGLSDRICLGI